MPHISPPHASQPTDILSVSDFLIHLAYEEERAIIAASQGGEHNEEQEEIQTDMTNLKLQKLLFFAQAAHLVLNNSPIFEDDIEAWQHGPVVPRVYRKFKDNGSAQIPEPQIIGSSITEYLRDFLRQIWQVFGKFSAMQLVEMTHNGTPWKDAFLKKERGSVISTESMKSFYEPFFKQVS